MFLMSSRSFGQRSCMDISAHPDASVKLFFLCCLRVHLVQSTKYFQHAASLFCKAKMRPSLPRDAQCFIAALLHWARFLIGHTFFALAHPARQPNVVTMLFFSLRRHGSLDQTCGNEIRSGARQNHAGSYWTDSRLRRHGTGHE